MGLYKLCSHKGRLRDRCDHLWWGSFRGVRVSLSKWANRDVTLKTDAQSVLDDVRAAIRAGTFDPRGQVVREITPMTFREFAEIYKERHAIAKGLSLARTIDWRLRPLLERFGDWALADIKTADVEDFIADLRKPRIVGREPVPRSITAASVNRTVELLRHMMNWAVGRDYIDRTPFRRGSETLIKKLLEDNKRRRRLSEDEEAKLLAAAPLHLRAMIIAALDTGMRRGEMLALRFADIDWTRELIVLRGETTKSRKTRMVPISTERLRAVLAWLRLDAEGEPKPADTPIFSNEIGEPLPHFHDVWLRTVLKAHGVRPRWAAGHDYKGLSTECKATYRRIDLRWHDLRHEYASRLVERGVPLAQVRDLLGHASITTTERYDTQKLENLQVAVTRLERGLSFSLDPASWTRAEAPAGRVQRISAMRPRKGPAAGPEASSPAPLAGDSLSSFFQELGTDAPTEATDEALATEAKQLSKLKLGVWLGGRDSNPDNVVQSHVSYR